MNEETEYFIEQADKETSEYYQKIFGLAVSARARNKEVYKELSKFHSMLYSNLDKIFEIKSKNRKNKK